MTPDKIITAMRQRGVQLWVEGEQLRYKGDRGTLTAEVLAELTGRKAELMAYLRAATHANQPAVPPIAPRPRTDDLPWS